MGRPRKTIDKEINCILPDNLNVEKLRESINTLNAKNITDVQFSTYLRLLDLISKKQFQEDSSGFVKLNSTLLQDNISRKYRTLISHLLQLHIIEFKSNNHGKPSYSTNNHESIAYRYTDTFRNESLALVPTIKRVSLTKKKKSIVDSYTENLLKNTGLPEYRYLQSWLHKVTFDAEAAKSDCKHWLESGALVKGKRFTAVRNEIYSRAINSLNEDAVAFTVKLSGKIYTNFTATPRALAKHLRLKGYTGTLLQSDVSSTHILLAMPAMRSYRSTLTNPEAIKELDKVEALVASKEFYKVLTKQLTQEGVTVRDEKEDFLKLVCNSIHKHTSNYKRTFEKLYPTFSEFLKVIRKGKAFTSVMNPIEADLFNNRIANRIYNELGSETFLLGKFDAFIYRLEDREAIEKIMDEEVFRATGLKGMVKTTSLNEESDKAVTNPSEAIESIEVAEVLPVAEEVTSGIEELADIYGIEWNVVRSNIYLETVLGDKFNSLDIAQKWQEFEKDKQLYTNNTNHKKHWLQVQLNN